ncbi:hypothetical protein AHAS_Ahas04G0259200 [Arachis hypogaea]
MLDFFVHIDWDLRDGKSMSNEPSHESIHLGAEQKGKMKDKEKTMSEGPQVCLETLGKSTPNINLSSQDHLPPQRLVPCLNLSGTILEEAGEAQDGAGGSTVIPPWMLQHLTS